MRTNNRTLIWNSWPTQNGQPADVVLGQPDFTSNTASTTVNLFSYPYGVYLSGTQLIVSDANNFRYLVFNGSY